MVHQGSDFHFAKSCEDNSFTLVAVRIWPYVVFWVNFRVFEARSVLVKVHDKLPLKFRNHEKKVEFYLRPISSWSKVFQIFNVGCSFVLSVVVQKDLFEALANKKLGNLLDWYRVVAPQGSLNLDKIVDTEEHALDFDVISFKSASDKIDQAVAVVENQVWKLDFALKELV